MQLVTLKYYKTELTNTDKTIILISVPLWFLGSVGLNGSLLIYFSNLPINQLLIFFVFPCLVLLRLTLIHAYKSQNKSYSNVPTLSLFCLTVSAGLFYILQNIYSNVLSNYFIFICLTLSFFCHYSLFI